MRLAFTSLAALAILTLLACSSPTPTPEPRSDATLTPVTASNEPLPAAPSEPTTARFTTTPASTTTPRPAATQAWETAALPVPTAAPAPTSEPIPTPAATPDLVPTPLATSEIAEAAQPVSLEGVARASAPLFSWENQTVYQELGELVSGQNGFVADFYRHLAGEEDGNLFYSPYSLYTALAVVYAGADGNTAAQFSEVMNIGAPPDRFHRNMNSLDLTLLNDSVKPNAGSDEGQGSRPTLAVANGLWIHEGLEVGPSFIDTVTSNYDTGLQQLDFQESPEGAAKTINQWIEEATQGKIKEAVSRKSITDDTVLMVTNAVYFKGDWEDPFEETDTSDLPFYLLDGRAALVPLMYQSNEYSYHIGDEYQAVSLPYVGNNFELLVVMPEEGTFEAFEESLTGESLHNIASHMDRGRVYLHLPRFKLEYDFSARDGLESLGLTDAFYPQSANFQPLVSRPSDLPLENLWIEDAIQKAFVEVNEEGTEAAASTALAVGSASIPPPPVEITIDRPFIFLLRHSDTGAILFMGRVLNPNPDAPTTTRSEVQAMIASEEPPPTSEEPFTPATIPMVIVGIANVNGIPAPPGTEIVAMDGDKIVGNTTTGEDGQYAMMVGKPEGIVEFLVSGELASQRLTEWESGLRTVNFTLTANTSG